MHSSERVAQKVELFFRYLTDACLLPVDRELQLAHDLAQLLQRLIGFAFPAQDHEIVRVGHDTSRGSAPARASSIPGRTGACKYSPAVVRWVNRNTAPVVPGFGRAWLPSSIIGFF